MEGYKTKREYVINVSDEVRKLGDGIKKWYESHEGNEAQLTTYQGSTYLTEFQDEEGKTLFQIEFSYNVRIPIKHSDQLRVIREYVANYNKELATRDEFGEEIAMYIHKKTVWLDTEICFWLMEREDDSLTLSDVFHSLQSLDDLKVELMQKYRIMERLAS